jgi:hypothetical protein
MERSGSRRNSGTIALDSRDGSFVRPPARPIRPVASNRQGGLSTGTWGSSLVRRGRMRSSARTSSMKPSDVRGMTPRVPRPTTNPIGGKHEDHGMSDDDGIVGSLAHLRLGGDRRDNRTCRLASPGGLYPRLGNRGAPGLSVPDRSKPALSRHLEKNDRRAWIIRFHPSFMHAIDWLKSASDTSQLQDRFMQ